MTAPVERLRDGKTWLGIGLLGLLAAALLAQTAWFRATKSITFDETFYLSTALQTVHDGRLDPALTQAGTAPLPVLLTWLPAAILHGGADRPDRWQGGIDDPEIAATARLLGSVLIGVPLVAVLFVWLWKRRGLTAATLAAGLAAFSPSILAHTAIATTDACIALAVLVAVAAITWMAASPSWPRVLTVGAVLGAAIAAKYSGVFLLPIAALALGVAAYRQYRQTSGKAERLRVAAGWLFARLAGLGLAAALTCWALHGFGSVQLGRIDGFAGPSTPNWMRGMANRELPSPVVGIAAQYLHNRAGHRTFLLGEASMTGWWYFFPYAALLKSTPVEVLVVLGLVVLLYSSRSAVMQRTHEADRCQERERLTYVWAAMLLYGAMMLTSRVQIGQRYLLPMYPLAFVLAADTLWTFLNVRSRSGGREKQYAAVAAVLLVGQAASALWIAPHYLAYFSPIVGGPSEGYRLLADSNIDWGQDLPLLRRQLERMQCRRALLSYFGTAKPEAYGVSATPLRSVPPETLFDYDCVAVSTNHVSGIFPLDDVRLLAVAGVEPDARAGYSILLWDLRSPRTRERVQQRLEQIQSVTTPPAGRQSPN